MKGQFQDRLMAVLQDFDSHDAYRLTQAIYEYEERGGNLTPMEERLHEYLTAKIRETSQ